MMSSIKKGLVFTGKSRGQERCDLGLHLPWTIDGQQEYLFW